eukprot:805566_1
MPIICLGPVCVPITAIIPILLFIFKPIYVRLPKEYQQKIDYGIKQCQLALNKCFRKIGWGKSKKKKAESECTECNCDRVPNGTNSNHNNTNTQSVSDELIKWMQNEDEWDEFMEQSKTQNLIFIAYFTSPWCKPCKVFYPVFEQLCKEYASTMRFIKVDIDEFDDVALEHKVSKLPTFIKFKNGESCGSVEGPKKEELQQLFTV